MGQVGSSGPARRVSKAKGRVRFNSAVCEAIRFQLPQASHNLTAILHLYSMPRDYPSRQRHTNEIKLSVLYPGLGSRVWLQCFPMVRIYDSHS